MRGLAAVFAASLALLSLAAPGEADATGLQPLDLRVDGGEEDWRPKRAFTLRWNNPPGPVAAVRYRVLDPAGEAVLGETRIASPETSLRVSVPPEPAVYTAEVWLEDGGGNEGTPAAAKLRFDNLPPGQVHPAPVAGWIGRTAFPLALRLGHPTGPPPLSGIRGYAVSVDPHPGASPCSAAPTCSEAETDLRGGIATDILTVADLPAGVSYLNAVAVSGSGTRSTTPLGTVLRVDKTDPETRLDGAKTGWSKEPLTLTATAVDAESGMAATGDAGGPFTAIRVDGGAPRTAPGDRVVTTVIATGVHTVSYYARDAAGNVADGGVSNGRPNHAPATAVVKIDREDPVLAFAAAQDPLDPELILVRASDSDSGLDPSRGSIGVRRVGSGERFEVLPAKLSGGTLRARWDSGNQPPGEYEFRATAYDRAGNSATTESRVDGSEMRLTAPLKVATTLIPTFKPRSVPYGRSAWFGGRLLAGRGSALAGVPVQVIERFETAGSPRERRSIVTTDASGGFGLRLPPGPSRQIVAVTAATATLRGASSPPRLLSVRGRLRLRASSATARIGGAPVVFRGRVAGSVAEIPDDGKIVQLQFRLPGLPWREFRTIRTGANGRFRYAYRFADDDSRGARFQFRAFAPAQAGWPFEPAGSAPVTVTGR